MSGRLPEFEPHPLVRGGHLQTIAGRYWPHRRTRLASRYNEIALPDGDRLSLLDSSPPGWRPGRPVALLVHGLGGCARSPYAVRVAAKLVAAGIRTVRMNLRGAGSGFGLARGIYHGGRTEDLRAVAEWILPRAQGSPLALVGFSLGANLVLKLAAEAADEPLTGLDCVLAANPPLDLAACCELIRRPGNRVYDTNFVRLLRREVRQLHAAFPDLGPPDLRGVRTLYDFDNLYTAPRNGFAGAKEYYARSSAGPLLPRIRVPGLVIHARDDPFIPPDPIERAVFPPQLARELTSSGGHLGYISRDRLGRDHRWLDARLVSWLATHWNLSPQDGADPSHTSEAVRPRAERPSHHAHPSL